MHYANQHWYGLHYDLTHVNTDFPQPAIDAIESVSYGDAKVLRKYHTFAMQPQKMAPRCSPPFVYTRVEEPLARAFLT